MKNETPSLYTYNYLIIKNIYKKVKLGGMFFLIERTEIEITAQQVTSNLND